ncbi:hypothetical protein [Aldersonia kunmingensis]|uniref:hypothetical protein n=1 Tax=Aldersonia kunmingensis TaxID=408066 RepID=UPI00082DF116|nr:hypothetical protein [Aldersonia kunmingensis]
MGTNDEDLPCRVEFDAAVGIDGRFDRTALMKADPDAPWSVARGSGIPLTNRHERMLERRLLRRLTELGRQPVPDDNDIVGGAQAQNGDRVRAPVKLRRPAQQSRCRLPPTPVAEPHELKVAELVIENARSARELRPPYMCLDDGAIRFVGPATIVVLQKSGS